MLRLLRHYVHCAAFVLRGRFFRLARRHSAENPPGWQMILEERQPIRATEYAGGKIANLRRATRYLEGLSMPHGSWFSWWHFIPRPAAQNGFVLGRTLLGGKLVADYGGGLCQLSGIIYLTALRLGMRVHERHAHSRDIYREEERYTPLGADAAIVFGHKNLVFRNSTRQHFLWRFAVQDHELVVRVYAPAPVTPARLSFIADAGSAEGTTSVTTYRHHGGSTELVAQSCYLKDRPDEKT